jgi:ribonuclease P protein component
MLTFDSPKHNARNNKGGRRMDSVAFCFFDTDLIKEYAHEAHFSAKQSRACTSSRLSSSYGNSIWPGNFECTPRTRPQKTVCLISDAAAAADPDMGNTPPYSVIKKRADFLAANRGKRFARPGFVLLVHDRGDADPAIRLGITITKKVGNAVIRNRMRRRFRTLMQEMLAELGKAGSDHIIIGRGDGIEMDFNRLRADLRKALERTAS